MTDREDDTPVDLNLTRVKLRRRLTKLRKHKAALDTKLKEEVSTLNTWWIQDISCQAGTDRAHYDTLLEYVLDNEPKEDLRGADEEAGDIYQREVGQLQMQCSLMLSMKAICSASQTLSDAVVELNDLFNTDPEKNFSSSLKVLKDALDDLVKLLKDSSMEREHDQRKQAAVVLKEAYLLQTKLARPVKTTGADVKPALHKDDEGLGGLKMSPVTPPTFSGKQKDWQAFWSEFKPIHETTKYTSWASPEGPRTPQTDQPEY